MTPCLSKPDWDNNTAIYNHDVRLDLRGLSGCLSLSNQSALTLFLCAFPVVHPFDSQNLTFSSIFLYAHENDGSTSISDDQNEASQQGMGKNQTYTKTDANHADYPPASTVPHGS